MIKHVIMTALPPTSGHLDLINFAIQLDNGFSRTIVHFMPCEDEPFIEERHLSLSRSVPGASIILSKYPASWVQTPEEADDEDEFWNQWINLMDIYNPLLYRDWAYGFNLKGEDHCIVGSEPYCQELADRMGIKFFEYDIARVTNPIKATDVRSRFVESRLREFDTIPEFLKLTGLNFVVFGAESVGKTTLTHALGGAFNAPAFNEWARPYLERVGAEVTAERMNDIVIGQGAIDAMASSYPSHVTFQDTDLLSTIGYYRLYEDLMDGGYEMALERYRPSGRTYILLKSDVPFQPDPLRYGGDERETDDQYWTDLLEEFGCDYVVIDRQPGEYAYEYADKIVEDRLMEHYGPLLNYERRS